MPLIDLIGKNLNGCCCILIKRSRDPDFPSATNDSNDLNRPFKLPLYIKKYSSLKFSTHPAATTSTTITASTSDYDGDIEFDIDDSSLDFSSVYASPRFFFSSPGLSNSILDTPSEEEDEEAVAVHTNSPDPYSDFRKSMEEMVEARELHDVLANWGSLQELLLRYLSINPEPNHKFIAGAFADLLVSLMSPATSPEAEGNGRVNGSTAPAGCSCY